MTVEISGLREKLEFCCISSNTPLAFEVLYPIGLRSAGVEGYWRPDDGDIGALLDIAFRRYFTVHSLHVQMGTEDDGYYRFSCRLTMKLQP